MELLGKNIANSLAEHFGSVADGMIHAVTFSRGIWARKTPLPSNLADIAEYRAAHALPSDIQSLCDASNDGSWCFGEDRFWENSEA